MLPQQTEGKPESTTCLHGKVTLHRCTHLWLASLTSLSQDEQSYALPELVGQWPLVQSPETLLHARQRRSSTLPCSCAFSTLQAHSSLDTHQHEAFFCCLLGLLHCTPRSRLCIFRDAAFLHAPKPPQPAWLLWGFISLLSLPHLGDPAARVGAGTSLSELSGPQQTPPSPAEERWHGHRVLISRRDKQVRGFCCPGCHLVGLVWHMHLPGNGSQEPGSPLCQYSALLIQPANLFISYTKARTWKGKKVLARLIWLL